jgi:hypothetical protein
LIYGDSGVEIEFDDRVLAHLHIVIGAKLRRHEGFFFTWRDDPAVGDGRSSIWLESSIPLLFHFSTAERYPINREWIDQLTLSSNNTQGLLLTGEPGSSEPLVAPRSPV